MFIYCKNCDWSQDDFWSEDYTPLTFLATWSEALLRKDLDKEKDWDAGKKTTRQVVLEAIDDAKRAIENMKYPTYEQFKEENPECKCPKCGDYLTID